MAKARADSFWTGSTYSAAGVQMWLEDGEAEMQHSFLVVRIRSNIHNFGCSAARIVCSAAPPSPASTRNVACLASAGPFGTNAAAGEKAAYSAVVRARCGAGAC